MLAGPVVDQVWAALHDERPYDRELHVNALQALPGSLDRETHDQNGSQTSIRRPQASSPDSADGMTRQSTSALIKSPGRSEPSVPDLCTLVVRERTRSRQDGREFFRSSRLLRAGARSKHRAR
jgi:hypothetical protein